MPLGRAQPHTVPAGPALTSHHPTLLNPRILSNAARHFSAPVPSTSLCNLITTMRSSCCAPPVEVLPRLTSFGNDFVCSLQCILYRLCNHLCNPFSPLSNSSATRC